MDRELLFCMQKDFTGDELGWGDCSAFGEWPCVVLAGWKLSVWSFILQPLYDHLQVRLNWVLPLETEFWGLKRKALLFTCSYVTLVIQAWFWVVLVLESRGWHSEWWYRKGAFGGAGHRGEVWEQGSSPVTIWEKKRAGAFGEGLPLVSSSRLKRACFCLFATLSGGTWKLKEMKQKSFLICCFPLTSIAIF